MRSTIAPLIASVVLALFWLAGAGNVHAQTEIVITDAHSTRLVMVAEPAVPAPPTATRLLITSAQSLRQTNLGVKPDIGVATATRIHITSAQTASLTGLAARPALPPEEPPVVRIMITSAQSVKCPAAHGDLVCSSGPLVRPDVPDLEEVLGIDVSHHQGDIDWGLVRGDMNEFAFVKATEGVGFSDPKFQANMDSGDDAGLFMGAYHFARPDLGNTAAEEAQHFLGVAGDYVTAGFLRPALDLECGGEPAAFCTGATLLSNADLAQWVNDWIATVEAETGVEPILYVNSNYANNHLDSTVLQRDLWIAHWTFNPRIPPNTGIWPDWAFWQYSDQGSVDGIGGDVDLDIFNGDTAQLEDFVIAPSTVKIPGDLNCDGSIDVLDVIKLIQFIVGQITSLDC